jgi:hypothetical protein
MFDWIKWKEMESNYPNSNPKDLPKWVVKLVDRQEKRYGSRNEFHMMVFTGKHYIYRSPPAPGPRSVRVWYKKEKSRSK